MKEKVGRKKIFYSALYNRVFRISIQAFIFDDSNACPQLSALAC
ncbi:MAG: hypothetical protein ABIN01_15165 [Ferruginibacter sp.]